MDALYWLILGLILSALEILTPGFVIIWFGIGALVVSFLAFLGLDNLTLQVIIFCAISLVLTAMSRTIFKKYFIKNSEGNKIVSSIEKLIGEIGIVTEAINNDESKGRIVVNSQDWAARAANNELISVNNKVKVIKIEGIKLIVSPVDSE